LGSLQLFEPRSFCGIEAGSTRRGHSIRDNSHIAAAAKLGDRGAVTLFGLAALLAMLVVGASLVGAYPLSVTEVGAAIARKLTGALPVGQIDTVLFEVRLPRVFAAVLVGASIAAAGAAYQTLFRNPMAGPYVLGISSGASLGVAFVILGFSSSMNAGTLAGLGNWALVGASWLGAGAVMILIMFISVRVRDILTVLNGVLVSTLAGRL
jgi:iron complex transport system permease protein